MKSVCLLFQVHQPVRLKKYRFFEIGKSSYYYDDYKNEYYTRKVANNCYLQMNKIIADLINKYQGRFKVSYLISGTAIDQLIIYAPEIIESFQQLAQTGCVEFLAGTNFHSLSAIANQEEFREQVKLHTQTIETLFGKRPEVFANTGLLYSNEIGAMVSGMGFKAMVAEGSREILSWRNPHLLYSNALQPSMQILLNNKRLSDEIIHRFSGTNWQKDPLTAKNFVDHLNKTTENEKLINLFMDYEIFGERYKPESGIFDFITSLPLSVLRKSEFNFLTPSEIIKNYKTTSTLNIPHPVSSAGIAKNYSSWLGNDLQREAFGKLHNLYPAVKECTDEAILKDWHYLQISDHFYYMGTGNCHNGTGKIPFSPYESPYEAFINYMNILNDFTLRLKQLNPDY